MRTIVLSLLLLCASDDAWAQSLQVGGLNVTIGEPFEGAMVRLSAVYEMQYLESSSNDVERLWVVWRRAPGRETIGLLRERNGAVTAITRYWNRVPDTLARDFPRFLDEAKRLGGTTDCSTTAKFVNGDDDGMVLTGYRTVCGRYMIDHDIAFRVGNLPLSREWLSISVR